MHPPRTYRSEMRCTAISSYPSGHPKTFPRSLIDRDLGTRCSSRRFAFSAAWSSAICRPACASDRRRASIDRWSTRTRGSRSSRSPCAIPSSWLYESSYFIGFLDAIILPRWSPFSSSTSARSYRYPSRCLKDIPISFMRYVLRSDGNNLRSWIMRGNATGVSGSGRKIEYDGIYIVQGTTGCTSLSTFLNFDVNRIGQLL